jgi:hypothetical protein
LPEPQQTIHQESPIRLPQPPNEFAQIRRLIQRQLVDNVIWTTAGERAYVAAAGGDGVTIISGPSEYIVEWSTLQRVYKTLQTQGNLSVIGVERVLHADPEQAGVIIAILALFDHVEIIASTPTSLRYHEPDGPIRLNNPRQSPFAGHEK